MSHSFEEKACLLALASTWLAWRAFGPMGPYFLAVAFLVVLWSGGEAHPR